jgi:sugar lactone lactonase YvrE
MYHADTERQIVWQYQYDIETGHPAFRRIFLSFSDQDKPDGLTTDSLGRLYVSLYSGGRIDCFTSDGKLANSIKMPIPNVTNCVFGGSDLKTLYITTACDDRHDLSGKIFKIEMDVSGISGAYFPLSRRKHFDSRQQLDPN